MIRDAETLPQIWTPSPPEIAKAQAGRRREGRRREAPLGPHRRLATAAPEGHRGYTSAARKPIVDPSLWMKSGGQTPNDDDRVEERVKALSKLPPGDVIKRLRQLGQPVTLFGESADERIRRFGMGPARHDPRNEGEDDFRLRGGHEITETKETKEKDEKMRK